MTRAETAERSIGIETSRRLSFVDIGLLLRIDAVLQPRPVGGRIFVCNAEARARLFAAPFACEAGDLTLPTSAPRLVAGMNNMQNALSDDSA